jgi:hypothetical protein
MHCHWNKQAVTAKIRITKNSKPNFISPPVSSGSGAMQEGTPLAHIKLLGELHLHLSSTVALPWNPSLKKK